MSDSHSPAPGRIERRPVHRGRVLDLGVDTVRFPDGSTGELEMIHHSGAAAVLPVLSDPDGPDPQIVLVRQYRYATGGWLYILRDHILKLLVAPEGAPTPAGPLAWIVQEPFTEL